LGSTECRIRFSSGESGDIACKLNNRICYSRQTKDTKSPKYSLANFCVTTIT
uniref:Uncharacterized protein n=1 Tax=Mesocestoides corti TaxID=53468 RepID=A0A5K3G5C0_MESCO